MNSKFKEENWLNLILVGLETIDINRAMLNDKQRCGDVSNPKNTISAALDSLTAVVAVPRLRAPDRLKILQ